MPPVVSRQAATLILHFDDREQLGRFFEEAQQQDGFLLTVGDEPRLFHQEQLQATLEGGEQLAFEAQVIQSFPAPDGQFSAAFQLMGFENRKAALQRLLAPPATDADDHEYTGTSPAFRIREMNVAEKSKLAVRADRMERQILVRDSTPPVLLALLNNPWIEDEEVLAVVKSHFATGGIFQRVMSDKRWRANYPIRLAIATNPKTPQPLALSLIPTLRSGDIRRLARGQDLREAIRREILRAAQKLR